MRSIKLLRLIGVGAMAASATFWLMYMATGIGYGSLVGLRGRELDMQAMSSRATVDAMIAIICQVLAWVVFVSSFRHANGTSPWSRPRPWLVAVSVSLIGTVAIIALFVYVNRTLRLV
jgi:hypothetical protein